MVHFLVLIGAGAAEIRCIIQGKSFTSVIRKALAAFGMGTSLSYKTGSGVFGDTYGVTSKEGVRVVAAVIDKEDVAFILKKNTIPLIK